MPKINVYLPDELAAAVRNAHLPVSPICQRALAEAVDAVERARKAVELIRDPSFDLAKHPQASVRLSSRMTPRLQEALRLARGAAGSGLVESEHLLVGVIEEADNAGVRVLQALEVDVVALRDAATTARTGDDGDAVSQAASDLVARARRKDGAGGDLPAGKSTSEGSQAEERPSAGEGVELFTGLSGSARSAIASALEVAVDLGHNYVGCEHLLLGLVEDVNDRAGRLLRDRGIEASQVRGAIASATLESMHVRQVVAPSMAMRLDEIVRRLDEMDERLREGGL